ncbi:DUF7289 family protein [Halonotius roseus]|uniref:Uncharacterized protein n=1 Tax=Halonotius roseus TaxID=2511997 RepID=A0A544QMR7_9EURY|nr:hypothetical protein [Halonotius roseus]TQQ80155.1 hypothetical protein EWF95_06570 [Halonotius roseus]
MDESDCGRGVSDVLGYIMIFGMILTLTFVATTTGITEISSQQQSEQIATVERGFQILDRDFETIQTHKDSRKATPLNIQSGSIGYGEIATITIGEWDTSSNEFTADNTSIATRTITYQNDNTELVYEGGLLFNDRTSRETLSRTDTGFVVEDTKAVIPVVSLNTPNPDFGVAPSGELVIQSVYSSDTQTTAARTVTGETLKIAIESTKPAGWERQLADEGFENVERDGSTVRASITVDGTSPETAVLSPTAIQTDIET